jgi:hypothetical protein
MAEAAMPAAVANAKHQIPKVDILKRSLLPSRIPLHARSTGVFREPLGYQSAVDAKNDGRAVGKRAGDFGAIHGDGRVGAARLRHIDDGGDVDGNGDGKMIQRGVAIRLDGDGAAVS